MCQCIIRMDGMSRQSGTQIPGAAVPVAEAGGHDSCRHLAAGFCEAVAAGLFSAGGPSHHWRSQARLLSGSRLREGARRGGCRHPIGLRRGLARRAAEHNRWLPGACGGVVQRTGDDLPPDPLGQTAGPWRSSRYEPSPTHHKPTARQNGSSKPC